MDQSVRVLAEQTQKSHIAQKKIPVFFVLSLVKAIKGLQKSIGQFKELRVRDSPEEIGLPGLQAHLLDGEYVRGDFQRHLFRKPQLSAL